MVRQPKHVDLDDESFASMCLDLSSLVSAFAPDLIVGIETGGAFVAVEMSNALNVSLVTVRVQRGGTRIKSKLRFGRFASLLPPSASRALRWIEVELREVVHRIRSIPDMDATRISGWEGLRTATPNAKRLLVVDDTVDSGRTLEVVVRATRVSHPNAEVRTAVLTSTWRNPPFRPDYLLLERTLLKFPWSFDTKNG